MKEKTIYNLLPLPYMIASPSTIGHRQPELGLPLFCFSDILPKNLLLIGKVIEGFGQSVEIEEPRVTLNILFEEKIK